MPDIKLPDGRLIKGVPEGITKEQLTSKLLNSGVLSGNEEWLTPTQPKLNQQPQISQLETLARAGAQGASFGVAMPFGSMIAAGIAKVYNQITKDESYNRPLMDMYHEALSANESRLKAGQEQHPVTAIASDIVGSLGTGGEILKATGYAKPTFDAAVKGSAILGGTRALGETKDIADPLQVGEDVLTGAGTSALIGGAFNKALPAAVNATEAISQLPKKLLQKAVGVTPKTQETIKAFEQAGVNPTLANVTKGQTTKTFQNLLGNFPGSRGEIEKATQGQIDDITKQIAGITKSEGGTIQETGKKIQQGAVNVKSVIEGRIKQNYDDMDKYILTESQKQTNPKLLDAIDEWTKLKELESHLINGIQKNAKAASLIGSSPNYSKEYQSLKNLEEDLIASVKGNSVVGSIINEDAKQKLGFWRNRAREKSSEFINEAANDAPFLLNVKKQISNEFSNLKPLNSEFLSESSKEAKNLNNIKKQILSQEKIISDFEKYMSPKQFQSALISGNAKIPTKNLQALTQDSHIQDVVAVGAGDTSRVMARYNQIIDDQGNISYPRLKIFRSTVGAKLQSPSLGGDERAALKKIYGALSEDMKSAVVANGGEKGLQAFNKANKSFARYQDVLESKINPIIEAKTPEVVYSMAMSGTKQGGSNIRGIMKTLDPEQKQFVQGTITKRMGLANAGQQGAEGEVFSPAKFLTEWNKLSPEAKTNIYEKGQVEAINNLNKVIETIKETNKAKQSSNNLPYAAWIGLGSLSSANLPAGVAAVGGAKITAKMMTNSRFINWLATSAKVKPAQIPAHLSQLSKIAAANPDIREETLDFIQSITQSEQTIQ